MIRRLVNKVKRLNFDRFKFKKGYHYVPDIYGKSSRKLIDIREDKLFHEIAKKVITSEKTYLYYDRLFNIYQALLNTIEKGRHADRFVALECGVFKGGCSYFMASLLQQLLGADKYTVYSIDTFEGHSAIDIPLGRDGEHLAGQFSDTSYAEVKNYLSVFKEVAVVKSRVQDYAGNLKNIKFDFIHLDMDIYEPTVFSLKYFNNNLKTGGFIVIDDYNFKSCPGIKKAIDEFKIEHKNYAGVQLLTGQYMLIKLAN